MQRAALVLCAVLAAARVAAAQDDAGGSALASPDDPAAAEASREPGATDPAVDGAAFARAARFLDDGADTWVLDDGVGLEELPWNGYDRKRGYLPAGFVHTGVQLRLAAVLGDGVRVPEGPLVEIAGFIDVRYRPSRPWRIRLAIAASFQSFSEQYLGAGTTVSTSPVSLRSRVLFLNFDIMRWMNVRVGGDLGIQWTPVGGSGGHFTVAGGPTAEVTVLLLDGTLELGVAGGMQLTAYKRTTRSYESNSFSPQAVIGGTVAYLVP